MAKEKELYDPRVHIVFQPKAWLDTSTLVDDFFPNVLEPFAKGLRIGEA